MIDRDQTDDDGDNRYELPRPAEFRLKWLRAVGGGTRVEQEFNYQLN